MTLSRQPACPVRPSVSAGQHRPLRAWHRLHPAQLAAASLAALLAPPPAGAATYSLHPIAIPGIAAPAVSGMAANGRYYGSYRPSAHGALVPFSVLGSSITIHKIGHAITATFAVNAAGGIAGYELLATSGPPQGYEFLVPPGGKLHRRFQGNGEAVIAYSDAGDILGRVIGPGGAFAGVLKSPGAPKKLLRQPGFRNSVVIAMNSAAEVIGYSYGGKQAGVAGFSYANGVFTTLHGPDGGAATPVAINDGGAMVINASDGGTAQASFLLASGVFTKLAFPGAIGTYAQGINNQNAVYGSYMDTANGAHFFVYKAGAYTSFDPPSGASVSGGYLAGMDDAGNLVGAYTRAGRAESFYAVCAGTGC